MKKYLLIPVLILVFCWPCSAGMVQTPKKKEVAGASCGTPSTGSTHEDWNTGTEDLTWSDSGSTVDHDESTIASGQCGFDTDWLELTLAAGAWGRATTSTDVGSGLGDYYARFFLYIESEGLSDSQTRTIHNASTFVGDSGNVINFRQATGPVYDLYIAFDGTERDSETISLQTAYCVEYMADDTNGGWEWRITEISGGTYPAPSTTGFGAHDPGQSPDLFKFGTQADAATNIPISFVIDNFDISTSDWLGCDE